VLKVANNLSDVASAPTALGNLGGLAKSANLSDVANATTARTNLGAVAKAGDTMTGNLTIAAPSPVLALNAAAAGQVAVSYAQTNGSTRWAWGKSSDAEAGSNSGSTFAIWRNIDMPFSISRQNAMVTTLNGLTVGTTATGTMSPPLYLASAGYSIYMRANNSVPAFEIVNAANTAVNMQLTDNGMLNLPRAGFSAGALDALNALVNIGHLINQNKMYLYGYGPSYGVGILSKPQNDNSPALLYCLNAAGVAVGSITTNASQTFFNTTSDYRLKENVADLTGAEARIMQCRPVSFTWKATGKPARGFIAHELQDVEPDAVSGQKDAMMPDPMNPEGPRIPDLQGVDSSYLIPDLVATVQALLARVAELEAAH